MHRSLESYRLPSRLRGGQGSHGPLPERLTPIFRDREDLSSAGQLGPQIELALAESEALVVVCSPEAARSPYVESEVLAFKQYGRGQRIYAFIVAGEPNSGGEQECFPNALRFELGADGQLSTIPANPIAADAREGKDGKALARLKLLAGLFGLPLDALRQRESQRRHRRMLWVTATSIAGVLLTSFLAVQAVIARNAAERRQKQAEDLVGFMLGDLTDKLLDFSRLDLLSAVNDKAMQYFKSLPATDVTDEVLEQRAKALMRIGGTRLDQGQFPQALDSFQAAAGLSGRLASAAPRDMKRQLAYAEVLAYIGKARWDQGNPDGAQRGFDAAHAVLARARLVEPDNPELLFQLSTVDNNNGHVLEARGQVDAATTNYRRMLDATRRLVALDPANTDWQNQLGLAYNNLAKMALLGGNLRSAVDSYRADMDIEAKLSASSPRNNAQRERLLIAKGTLGRTLALTGELDEGIALLRQALEDARQLQAFEPDSTSFQENVGLYSTQLARLLRQRGDTADAASLAARSKTIFERLVATDSTQSAWQREHAETLTELAAQAIATSGRDKAVSLLDKALAILEPQLDDSKQDRATVLATVDAWLRMATLSPDAERSALAQRALASIEAQTSAPKDPRLLALRVESLLLLGREPEAKGFREMILASGYRDAGFMALLHENNIASTR